MLRVTRLGIEAVDAPVYGSITFFIPVSGRWVRSSGQPAVAGYWMEEATKRWDWFVPAVVEHSYLVAKVAELRPRIWIWPVNDGNTQRVRMAHDPRLTLERACQPALEFMERSFKQICELQIENSYILVPPEEPQWRSYRARLPDYDRWPVTWAFQPRTNIDWSFIKKPQMEGETEKDGTD